MGLAGRLADHLQLPAGIPARLIPAGLAEGLPDPFSDSHMVPPGEAADLGQLGGVQQDLKPLTHADEYIILMVMSQMDGSPVRR